MQLYYSRNLNPRLAVAVAKHLKSPVTFIPAAPRVPQNEDAFRPINPNTLVPVLVENGASLWECDAIACRLAMLARSDFWPTDERLPDLIRWVSWSAHHFTRAGGVFYFEHIVRPKIFTRPPNEPALAAAAMNLQRFAPILDEALGSRAWLVADKLSYADFRVACVLPFAEDAKLPIRQYRNIMRWHDRLNELDAWRTPFDGLE